MNSSEYWRQRETEHLRQNLLTEREYYQQLSEIYSYMLDQCTKEIAGFYARYARKEGIDLAEARTRVAKIDMEAYQRKAKKYVKEKDFSAQANEEMRLYNATMRINRLELLKANIGLELVAGFDEMNVLYDGILTDRAISEFTRLAGILGDSVKNSAETAKSIVNASFQNATFSQRIWMYQGQMKAEVAKMLQTGLIQGKNPREFAGALQKLFGVSKASAERLMRTELARVQTAAQEQSLKANGFTQYQFHALGTACGLCRDINEKVYDVKDMMPGTNAPPMHPNCRCSVSAYMDSAEYRAWIESIDEHGLSFKEWKNEQEGAKHVSGAVHGAYTDENDPIGKKRDKAAEKYYNQVRNRKREYEIEAVSKNTGFNKKDIDQIFSHVFELEHLFEDGSIHRFHPDYYMQQSWMRMRSGKGIQPHDITMLNHELMEAKIMGKGTDIEYESVHREVEKVYNYQKELLEYLKTHDA